MIPETTINSNYISPQSLDNPSKHPLLPSLLASIYLPTLLAYGSYNRALFCKHRWLGFIWITVVCAILVWIGVLLGFDNDAWAPIGLAVAGTGLVIACGRVESADRKKLEEQEGQITLEQ